MYVEVDRLGTLIKESSTTSQSCTMSETIIDAIDRLMPLIIHSTCLHSNLWDAPHQQLPLRDYSLSWAIVDRDRRGRVSYQDVTSEMVEVWEDEGIDWQQRAAINLKVASQELWTHQKLRKDGSVVWAIMMHNDGFGSSRVLLSPYLDKYFPDGYYVAIPDRSIGIIIPNNLSVSEMQETQDLLESWYDSAAAPMSPHLFAPDDLIPEHYHWN
jgi:hypothetical protein